ncbi:MAG: AroM family protein [Acetobacteraceae bacterium]
MAFVTIGQAPRPDIVPEILGLLDVVPEHAEFGALDGLDAASVLAHAPHPGEARLYTRLASGAHLVVGTAFIEDRLEALISTLDPLGYDLIVVISTGIFRPLSSRTPVVHGQRALDAWIAALVLGDCRIGVIYPLSQQIDSISRHGTLIENARSVAATGETGRLEDAAARLGPADLILLHSVGYTEAMAREVAEATGKPVVTARRIIAGLTRLQLGTAGGLEIAPPAVLGGGALLDRLPQPSLPLSERERAVLRHVLEGRSNKEIGRLLGISFRTVEIHRARAIGKFGTNSTSGLVRRVLMGRR